MLLRRHLKRKAFCFMGPEVLPARTQEDSGQVRGPVFRGTPKAWPIRSGGSRAKRNVKRGDRGPRPA